jgi:hypothetical protein
MLDHSFVQYTKPYNTNQPQDNQAKTLKTEIYQTRIGAEAPEAI